jgi:hypothetical protein
VTDFRQSRFFSISKNPLSALTIFMNIEVHLIMHFFWRRGASNEQIMSQIKETYEDGGIHVLTVQRWTLDFAAGRTELGAPPRPGQLIDPENADRIRELLESEPDISEKTLSRRLNLHLDTDHQLFPEALGVCKVKIKSGRLP